MDTSTSVILQINKHFNLITLIKYHVNISISGVQYQPFVP